MIDIQLQPAPESFSGFKDELERLFMARQQEPSTSFEWTEALRAHHLDGDDEFLLLMGRREHRLCLFIPMVREQLRIGWLPLINLRVIWERYNTHSDLLCECLNERAVEILLEGCQKVNPRWDVMRFTRVLENSDLDRAFSRVLPCSGLRFRSRLEPPSFFLRLPDSLELYLQGRSSKFRNYLSRMEKKLRALGSVRFVKHTSREKFSDAYNALLSVELASWKHEHGTAISAVPHQTTFYRELSREAQNSGRLHLTFLMLSDLPVAYNLGMISNGRYYYLKTSFNEIYRPQGVATVCRARLIRMLIEEGLKEFDFPGEPYEWEKQWTHDLRWHRSFTIYNKTGMGFLYSTIGFIHNWLHRKSRKRNVEYHEPLSMRPHPDRKK